MPGHFLQKSRHGSVYYFRRRVPDDLRTALGKHQLYKSLETCDRREAIIRARALAAKTDTLFAHIRTMPDKELPSLDYSMLIEFDDTHGKPKKIQIEADGREDQEAAQKAIDALLPALTSPHYEHANRTLPALGSWGDPPDLIRPRKTIREAINEYTERGDIKPTSRMSYRTTRVRQFRA